MTTTNRHEAFMTSLREVFGSAVDHENFVTLYTKAMNRSRSTGYRRLHAPQKEDWVVVELLRLVQPKDWPIRWHLIRRLMSLHNAAEAYPSTSDPSEDQQTQ